jgi:hypothetical protein
MAQKQPVDPWGVASVTPSAPAAPSDPWGVASVAPAAPPQQGFVSSAADSSGASSLGDALLHPFDTAKGIARSIANPYDPDGTLSKTIVPAVANTVDNVKQGVQDFKTSGLSDTTRRDFGRAVPFVGPVLAKAQGQHDAGNDAGMAGTLAGFVGGSVAPEAALKGVKMLPGMAKTAIAGDVTKPMTGTNVSPLDRFNSANNLGVKLDAADATNSGPLKMIKKVNENSLLGGGLYDKLSAANDSALQGSTDNFLNKMYPGEREEGGLAIQKGLQANQADLQSRATKGFDSLPQDIPVPGLKEVGKTAQNLASENSAYHGLFPSLKPNKAMSVVGDVGGLGPQAPAPIRMSPFVDESGKAIPSSTQPAPAQPQSFSTAQKLRSDLLDFRRNNPDIVANQGDAMIGNLAGKTDDAITGASSLLNPDQLKTFRDANAAWGDMKQTYDDPSSPLYHAVRTDNPSSLYSNGVGSKTPENARNLQNRLGPAIDPLRRGTVEGALKTNANGSPNFKTFGTQLNRIPADYRAELFSPDQNSTLRDIANTSNVLKMDANPSGSGKLAQQVGEGAMLFHPATMAAPLLQYPLAKAMTSPGAVNWLMRPPTPVAPLSMPASAALSAASLAAAPKKKGLYGR